MYHFFEQRVEPFPERETFWSEHGVRLALVGGIYGALWQRQSGGFLGADIEPAARTA